MPNFVTADDAAASCEGIQPESAAARRPAARTLAACEQGHVIVYLDVGEFDFHIDVAPEARTCRVRHALKMARQLGFKPIPEDEHEPELLNNGWVRMYLVPIEPVPDMLEDHSHWQAVITTIPMQVSL